MFADDALLPQSAGGALQDLKSELNARANRLAHYLIAVWPPLTIVFVALWGIRLPSPVLLSHAWCADAIWASFAFGSISAMLMLILYYQWADWRGPLKATAHARTSGRAGLKTSALGRSPKTA
jgi:hypothetical protein